MVLFSRPVATALRPSGVIMAMWGPANLSRKTRFDFWVARSMKLRSELSRLTISR
jgi:hypothetical protein